MSKKEPILQDHKRQGKKLLPPFNYMLTPGLTDLSWVDIIMPELIWISLLNDSYGYAEGARLVAQVGKKSSQITNDNKKNWCYSISSFLRLTPDEKAHLYDLLGGKNGDAGMIGSAIKILHERYPKSPFLFLTEGAVFLDSPENEFSRFKDVLNSIYDKTTKEGIFTQANVVYSAFVADRLKVRKGLALAEFPEVEHYPNTEKSKIIAASIRSSVPMFFGMEDSEFKDRWWPTYFWNRGMELEPCEFS